MVKKITSAAFLLLVMVNHTFCDINNNKIPDKASKTIDQSAKSSSEIKANKNKSNQKHSTLTIGGILTIISTFFVILEKASIVLTGKPFTLASEEVKPASLEEIQKAGQATTICGNKIKKQLLDHLQAKGLNKRFSLLKSVLEKKSDEEVRQLIALSLSPEGYDTSLFGCSWGNSGTPIYADNKLNIQNKIIYHINNYIHAFQ